MAPRFSLQGALTSLKKHRKGLSLAGAGTGIIGLILFGILALLPLKLEHIVKGVITKHFDKVEDIIDRRVDRYTETYINKYIFRRMSGRSVPVIATGNLTKDVFDNWSAEKFESKLKKNQSIEFAYDKGKDRLIIKTPTGDIDGGSGSFKISRLNNREARAFLKTAIRDETKWFQVYKRRHTRNLLMQKYKVRSWRMFEDNRQKVDDKLFAAKKKLKLELIDHVVRPVSEKYALYFTCIVEGCSLNQLDPDLPNQGKIGGDGKLSDAGGFDANGDGKITGEEADNLSDFQAEQNKLLDGDSINAGEDALDEVSDRISKEAAESAGNIAGNEIVEELQKTLTSQILRKVGFGIGLLELMVTIDNAVQNDTIGKIIEDKNKLQYANVFADYAKLADQLKAGKLSSEEVSAVMGQLDGVEQSRIMQNDFKTAGLLSAPTALAQNGECDGNPLPAGELVCPDKKVKNENLKDIYKNPTFDMIHVLAEGYKKVGAPVRYALKLIGAIGGELISWILDHIPGADRIQSWLASGLNKVMGYFFGPVVSGNEKGGDLYNAIEAGADVTANSVAQLSLGGRKLTDAEALALDYEGERRRSERALTQSFFDRYFSTENTNSLVSQLAVALPTGRASMISASLGLISLPQRLGQAFLAIVWPSAHAIKPIVSPHGVDQYGWPLDDPATQAYLERDPVDNPYTEAECAEIEKQWEQNRASGNGSTNMLNPCRVERVVSESLNSMFTEEDDGGLGLNGISAEEETDVDLADGTTQDLAKEVLNISDGSITYDSEGIKNTLVLASQGQKVPTGDGNFTVIRASLLRLILAIHEEGISIRISSFTGGEHSETSLHYLGKALDIGNEEVAGPLMKFVYKNRKTLNIDELIYASPPNGTSNLDIGNPHEYSSGTLSAHKNHIHIAVF